MKTRTKFNVILSIMGRKESKATAIIVSLTAFVLSALVAPKLAAGQTCTLPPTGLVSWWPGDGNADDIEDGNDGTLLGGVTFAPGLVGQAFSFDGVDAFVSIHNPSNLKITDGLTLAPR